MIREKICGIYMPKPSFFQKLTGADEPEEDIIVENKTQKTNEEVEQKIIAPATPVNNPAPVKNKSKTDPPSEKSAEEKEWLPESEGQLTIDVYQTPSDIFIKSTIAGVMPEDIDVSISNDMVTIKGVRKKDVSVAPEDYYYQECYWGPFSRSVILPVDIEADKAEASMKNGILSIRLPKIEKVKTRKLKIKTV